MYSENQTPSTNSLGEPPQPATFGVPQGAQDPKTVRPKRKKTLWIVVSILVAVLFAAGILWAVLATNTENKTAEQNTGKSSEQQDENGDSAPTGNECAARERRYQNRDLSLGFCYPNEWGNVSVEDAFFDPSDDGTRLRLMFANKPKVHIGLVSDDWSTDAAREGVCADPATQTLPDFTSFSARWTTEGPAGDITSATRGLEISTDDYIIKEYTDSLLTNGVCLTGFKLTEGEVYRHAEASYSAAFTAAISSPQAHVNDPTTLVPVADRTAFIALVKSMYAY